MFAALVLELEDETLGVWSMIPVTAFMVGIDAFRWWALLGGGGGEGEGKLDPKPLGPTVILNVRTAIWFAR